MARVWRLRTERRNKRPRLSRDFSSPEGAARSYARSGALRIWTCPSSGADRVPQFLLLAAHRADQRRKAPFVDHAVELVAIVRRDADIVDRHVVNLPAVAGALHLIIDSNRRAAGF